MRLNGGEFLLDFTALSLTDSASSVTISNKEILSALTELKVFINNQLAIKPVWVKFIDDDTDEIIVARGEIRKAIGDLEFDLFISSKGHSLSIHIEFTQMVDSDSNPLDDYYIASGDASYVYTSAQPIFEEITDKDGHKRFIEGDGTYTALEGYNVSYCKWSLSGSHLMFVVAGRVEDEVIIPNGHNMGVFTLPEWIYDKIYIVWSSARLEVKNVTFTADNWSSQVLSVCLNKVGSNQMTITATTNFTLTDERGFRIAFDLLIDNE